LTPVDQNGLDFSRPPDSAEMTGVEENAAAPHFPPLPKQKIKRSPSEVEVNIIKVWLLVRKRIFIENFYNHFNQKIKGVFQEP
jgi:hypothetical protein